MQIEEDEEKKKRTVDEEDEMQIREDEEKKKMKKKKSKTGKEEKKNRKEERRRKRDRGTWKRRRGKVVVCRIERKQNKKHVPSSDLDEGRASDNLAYDSGNNVVPEVEPLVPAEWDDALIGYYELQYSPISSVDSIVWNTPLESEQEDDFGNLKWDIQDVFFGEETGHSLPLDVNSPKTVTEAHIRNGCDEIAICVNYCYISQ
ncbi:hypothetical protein LWI29_002256 [Acer saccharum]|uniref:Uncharacterized protein n=1 Tax=Acer saccharum TaxID=4024 RepID=A0AA39S0K1_ACESA|nr:hypothetical protein LWI29_002256 [Acer saccharum]